MKIENEKIWIAGHNGMLGSALIRKLKDCDIVTCSRSEVDLIIEDQVDNWFKHQKPSIVFLAAAKVGGISANTKYPVEFLLNNLKIQNNVIKASSDYGVKKLVFLGSACSYPKNSIQPIIETSFNTGEPEPTNIWYATAKIAGIKLAQAYHVQNDLNVVIAMPTNSYGPGDNFDEQTGHVIPALMKKLHKAKENHDKSITIWGSGHPKREFVFVDDLADALIFLCENYNSPEIINIGSSTEISIFELTQIIASIVGFKGEILTDETKPDGMMRKLLDSNKINKLGWQSKTKLLDGLALMYDWAKINNKL